MESQTNATPSRKWSMVAAVLLVVLPLAYLLSYAPLYRLMLGGDETLILSLRVPRPAWWEPAYMPVVFLTENTPLGTPLLWWAEVWDVQLAMIMDRDFRMQGLP